MKVLLFLGLLISLTIVQIDGKWRRFSYGGRNYRPYPLFARARAVWHPPPEGLRYRQLGEYEEIPRVPPGIRTRIWSVKPKAIRRRILRSTPCVLPRESAKVMSVIREALRRVNAGRRSTKLAVESIGTTNIRTCKKCDAKGRCRYDHTKVATTVTLAPSCRSEKCKCGFEVEGIRQKCHLSGLTKYGMKAKNMTVRCKEETSFIRPKQQNRDEGKLVPVTTSYQLVTTSQRTTTMTGGQEDQETTTEVELVTTNKAVDPGLEYDLDLKPDVRPAPILGTKDKVQSEGELLQ